MLCILYNLQAFNLVSNMRIFLLLHLSIVISTALSAQETGVTHDGRYVWAFVDKTIDYTGQTLVIQSTIGNWKKEIPGASSARFTGDGRRALYMKGDTLIVLTLDRKQQTAIPQVGSYELIRVGSGERLAYRPNGPEKALVLRDLETGKETRIKDVAEYVFSANGNALVVTATVNQGGSSTTTLRWVRLPDGEAHTIWNGTNLTIGAPVVDRQGGQVAFLVPGRDSGGTNAIWWYRPGTDAAQVLAQDGSAGIDSGLVVANEPIAFSERGERLFFRLEERALPEADPKAVKVDVWSYLDPKLQSQQRKDLFPRSYAAAIGIADRRILRLERENEVVLGSATDVLGSAGRIEGEQTDDFALIVRFAGDVLTFERYGIGGEILEGYRIVEGYSMNEYNWNRATETTVYLVSMKDGSRKALKEGIQPTSASFPYYRFSPGGRYVVYYDEERRRYFSYEIATGTTRDLMNGVDARWAAEDPQAEPRRYYRPVWPYPPVGIQAWIGEDDAMLVGDHYSDLWGVDLSGRRPPVNLTNGYARRHDVTMVRPSPVRSSTHLRQGDTLLFEAFAGPNARRHRNAGLFRITLKGRNDPEILVAMGGRYRHTLAAKAANAEVYVVERESANVPFATFYTRDFKTFTAVTSRQPEQRRGLPQELITWTTFDGTISEGILLKPVDFDSTKKYPVIFDYYEKKPQFLFTGVGSGAEWEVTKAGYLIFRPDIHYTIGETGPSAYNSVVSAAKHLATLPFVDSTRMGIIGASFGGYETNYLVTHSNIFAAAASGCGYTNFFSFYGTEPKDEAGYSFTANAEIGQGRIGATPWERPDLYRRNSAIFNADKVTTPLLLFHNENDHRVPFSQSLELFIALRRLGKPAWLLQYGGGHGCLTLSFDASDDGSVRLKQFFDHYLKGAPAPRWMTRGIPYRMKGIDLGLELDPIINTPPRGGLLWKEEAKTPQQRKLLEAKTQPGLH